MILPDQDDHTDALSDVSDISYMSDLDNDPQSLLIDLSNGPPNNISNITFVHYNIDSITAQGRLDELILVCQTLSIDYLVISESHLDKKIPTNMISIPGFHEPARCDRKIAGRFGGGCLIYVSNRLTFEQKHDLQVDSFDHVWVDIKIDNTMYTVTTWYRPPNTENHDDFMTTSENILTKLHTHQADNKIIMADFNFCNCYSKSPVLTNKPLDSMAPELFESFGFTQVIDIPTRVTKDTVVLVDLIFIQNVDYMTLHGTLPKIANHDGIIATFHSDRPKELPRTRTVHNYNKINEEELIKYIKNLNFNDLVLSHSLEDQPQLITSLLTQAFSKFFPSKEVLIRPNVPAWTNTYTRLLQRRKNRNYILYKKLFLNIQMLLQVRIFCQKFNKTI